MTICAGLYSEYADGRNTAYMNDEQLMRAVEAHASKEFWNNYKSDPVTRAALRRYQSYLRREARSRGLGRLVDAAVDL